MRRPPPGGTGNGPENGPEERDTAPEPSAGPRGGAPPPDPGRVLEALRGVLDPEVGLDVVSMGLVYGVEVEGRRVRIRHTLTTRGCPMGAIIGRHIGAAARAVPGVEEVEVELVWEPEWHAGMIDDEAMGPRAR